MAGRAEAAGEVHLVDVSGCDVFFDRVDCSDEVCFREGVLPRAEDGCGVRRVVVGTELGGEFAGFPPLSTFVMVDEEMGVVAEGVLAVVVDGPAGCACGEGVVVTRFMLGE